MIVSNVIQIPKRELKPRRMDKLIRDASYVVDGIPITVHRLNARQDAYEFPRGLWAHPFMEDLTYHDKRACPKMPALSLSEGFSLDATLPDGRSFERQEEAVRAALREEQGLIIRPPGSGKTEILCAFIARCKTRVLVLVHTEDILNQWVERLQKNISDCPLGLIRGKKVDVQQVTLATVQTYYQHVLEDPDYWKSKFGAIIADEAHHGAATTWEVILNQSSARYRIGVTATKTRADGHHPYLERLFGPIIHEMKFQSKVPIQVVPIKSNFSYRMRGAWDWSNMVTRLIEDDGRNQMIAEVADREARAGNSTLILSRRIEHLERIAKAMREPSEILTGQRNSKDRKRILAAFRAGDIRVLLATQLADEALDVPILSRIVLTHPGKHDGRIIQQVGRAIREYPGKSNAVIYDVVDHKISILRRQWGQRKQAYRKMKIPIKGGVLKWR